MNSQQIAQLLGQLVLGQLTGTQQVAQRGQGPHIAVFCTAAGLDVLVRTHEDEQRVRVPYDKMIGVLPSGVAVTASFPANSEKLHIKFSDTGVTHVLRAQEKGHFFAWLDGYEPSERIDPAEARKLALAKAARNNKAGGAQHGAPANS